jgi:hypothetical protein
MDKVQLDKGEMSGISPLDWNLLELGDEVQCFAWVIFDGTYLQRRGRIITIFSKAKVRVAFQVEIDQAIFPTYVWAEELLKGHEFWRIRPGPSTYLRLDAKKKGLSWCEKFRLFCLLHWEAVYLRLARRGLGPFYPERLSRAFLE